MNGHRARALRREASTLLLGAAGDERREIARGRFRQYVRDAHGAVMTDQNGNPRFREWTAKQVVITGRRRLYKVLKRLWTRGLYSPQLAQHCAQRIRDRMGIQPGRVEA